MFFSLFDACSCATCAAEGVLPCLLRNRHRQEGPLIPVSLPEPDQAVARLRAAGCVFAEDEAQLLIAAAEASDTTGGSATLDAMIERRVAGFPLEQILGWAQFCGLRIVVEPGVFVPRRRTEFLAEKAIAVARCAAGLSPPQSNAAHANAVRSHAAQSHGRAIAVDLCCGAGAIGAALAAAIPGLELYAADLDPAAAHCARRNIPDAVGRVVEGDLYDPLPDGIRGRVDVLAVNAPYVPTDAIATMPPEARLHEARMALDGGADGLDIHRRVAEGARDWLASGGHLLVEASAAQAPVTAEIFASSGLVAKIVRSESLDATVIIGTNALDQH